MYELIERLLGPERIRRSNKLRAREARYQLSFDRSIGKWDPDKAWIVARDTVQAHWNERKAQRLSDVTPPAIATGKAVRL